MKIVLVSFEKKKIVFVIVYPGTHALESILTVVGGKIYLHLVKTKIIVGRLFL